MVSKKLLLEFIRKHISDLLWMRASGNTNKLYFVLEQSEIHCYKLADEEKVDEIINGKVLAIIDCVNIEDVSIETLAGYCKVQFRNGIYYTRNDSDLLEKKGFIGKLSWDAMYCLCCYKYIPQEWIKRLEADVTSSFRNLNNKNKLNRFKSL